MTTAAPADEPTFGEAMRARMREAVEDGTPMIVLTCKPNAYHMLVDGDGLTDQRVLLLLRAAVRRLERHLREPV